MPDALYSTVAEALQEAGYLSDCSSSATVVTPLAEDLPSGGDPTNIISPRMHWLPLLAAGGGWCLLSLGVIFCVQDQLALRPSDAIAANCEAGCQGTSSAATQARADLATGRRIPVGAGVRGEP